MRGGAAGAWIAGRDAGSRCGKSRSNAQAGDRRPDVHLPGGRGRGVVGPRELSASSKLEQPATFGHQQVLVVAGHAAEVDSRGVSATRGLRDAIGKGGTAAASLVAREGCATRGFVVR